MRENSGEKLDSNDVSPNITDIMKSIGKSEGEDEKK